MLDKKELHTYTIILCYNGTVVEMRRWIVVCVVGGGRKTAKSADLDGDVRPRHVQSAQDSAGLHRRLRH